MSLTQTAAFAMYGKITCFPDAVKACIFLQGHLQPGGPKGLDHQPSSGLTLIIVDNYHSKLIMHYYHLLDDRIYCSSRYIHPSHMLSMTPGGMAAADTTHPPLIQA